MSADPVRERLSGFGRATGSTARVRRLVDEAAVSDVLAHPPARGVLARGRGRSYGDAAQNAGGDVLRLPGDGPRVRWDEEGGTVTVGAGVSLDELLRDVVPRGWFVPVTPGTRQVTLGGALAADVHGKNHHRDGSLADHVTRVRLESPTGTHELSPTEDAEAFWATAGGMGLTGVITELGLRLLPIETSRVVVDTERTGDLDELLAAMEARDHEYRYSVAWVDTSVGGRRLGRGVLTRGDHATVDQLPADAGDPLHYDPQALGTLPPLPLRAIRPATIRAFNEAWYRRAPRHRVGELQPLGGFFHPLDAVHDWNGLYGPRGFLQYQFVVPFGAEDVVRHVLETLVVEHLPSALVVLKRFGDANPGPLSFPMPGWTLAVDLAVGPPHLRRVLRGFDDEVAAAGGRVYLAKDAVLDPGMLRTMYPRLSEWQGVRRRLDPAGVLQSDLARRLHLVDEEPS